jgi:hypothetical protein
LENEELAGCAPVTDIAPPLASSSRSSAVGIEVEAEDGADLSAGPRGEAGMLAHNWRIEVSGFMVAHDR